MFASTLLRDPFLHKNTTVSAQSSSVYLPWYLFPSCTIYIGTFLKIFMAGIREISSFLVRVFSPRPRSPPPFSYCLRKMPMILLCKMESVPTQFQPKSTGIKKKYPQIRRKRFILFSQFMGSVRCQAAILILTDVSANRRRRRQEDPGPYLLREILNNGCQKQPHFLPYLFRRQTTAPLLCTARSKIFSTIQRVCMLAVSAE